MHMVQLLLIVAQAVVLKKSFACFCYHPFPVNRSVFPKNDVHIMIFSMIFVHSGLNIIY